MMACTPVIMASGRGRLILQPLGEPREPSSCSTRRLTTHDIGATVPQSNDIPRRALGQTGEFVSALGLGGFHLGAIGTEREAIRIVHAAIEAGITFMDNAWEYHQG